MKLLSIDIETTGLNPKTDGILEIGCCLFDPQPVLAVDGKINAEERVWRTWQCVIASKRVQGDPFALHMNADILDLIAKHNAGKDDRPQPLKDDLPCLTPHHVIVQLRNWIREQGFSNENKVTVVGKNYDTFDGLFLDNLPGWTALIKPMLERRTLDVGSLMFCPDDGKVVNLKKCLERVGHRDEDIPHRALADAMLVATAVSRFFA